MKREERRNKRRETFSPAIVAKVGSETNIMEIRGGTRRTSSDSARRRVSRENPKVGGGAEISNTRGRSRGRTNLARLAGSLKKTETGREGAGRQDQTTIRMRGEDGPGNRKFACGSFSNERGGRSGRRRRVEIDFLISLFGSILISLRTAGARRRCNRFSPG